MKAFARVASALALAALWTATLAQDVPADCAEMVEKIGVPKYKGSDPAEHVILCRLGYVLAHNNDRLTPDWVLERLTPDRFSGPGDRKKQGDPFAPDPDLTAPKRAELKDYKGSGYDRGHMAPAATMNFSEEAMEQSFYLSNMAPQVGVGLNQHIWADLEAITRNWACERKEVIVITGPIYENQRPKKVGAVAVPTGFYKIAYDPKKKRAITFVLPNKKVNKDGKKSEVVLANYIKTIIDVEELTGLSFLDGIPSRDRRRIDSLKSVMWPTRKKCPKDDT